MSLSVPGEPAPVWGLTSARFKVKEFEELSEDAKRLISEATQLGTMTLSGNQRVVALDAKNLVDIVKWLATIRTKHHKVVSSPEDFQLRKTRQE